MKPLLHPELINDPLGDPALFVDILWEHRALLFDMGELGAFRPARLLKISHAFVSHTHIDHFIGFDTLLRLMLNREKTLKIYGPPGFLANIRGKLSGYTWNLTGGYSFSVSAAEVQEDRILSQTFESRERFSPGEERQDSFRGILAEDPHLQIRAAHLDHSIPCLGFALRERFHINVHKDRLEAIGLPAGPWLNELKEAIWREEGADFRLKIPVQDGGQFQQKEYSLGRLREAVTITPGQRIAYVADCRYTKENAAKIIGLARGADHFFCEAAFLDEERERAQERAHLTAREAGELAREAGAQKLHIFHFSPKYEKQTDLLYREAEKAFRG